MPHPLIRWLVLRERMHFTIEAIWLSDIVWVVKEKSEFASGLILERKMFAQLVAPTRIRLSAEDMPIDAEILLQENGFVFSPYCILAPHRGRVFRLRCLEECRLDERGRIHDVIRMYWHGFQVARMYLGPLEKQD